MAVLVDLGCSNKCTTGQVTYKWQKFISHSSAVLRYEDTSKFWWGFWWEPSSWFAVSQLLLVSSHSRKKTSWLWPFLIRALTSRMRAPPSWHNHSPKAQLLNIITLGLEFQPGNFKGTQTFSSSQGSHLLKCSLSLAERTPFAPSPLTNYLWGLGARKGSFI